MKVQIEREYDQLVCVVLSAGSPTGYLVIDSMVGGRASGGLRMMPDLDGQEVRDLAHAMTLKYGLLGIPRGGAKAGVVGDPEGPEKERRQQLVTFAQAVAPFIRSRAYMPGTDMGTTTKDLRLVAQAAGLGLKARDMREANSGIHTATTVFASVQEAARRIGLELRDSSVAIEGFGSVGAALALRAHRAGMRVVAVSTRSGALYCEQGLDVTTLAALAQVHGSRCLTHYSKARYLDPAALPELPVDVLCPCARHASITKDNVCAIKARIICPGANNPITPEAESTLWGSHVLAIPDFLANCGGVLGGAMDFAGFSMGQITRFASIQVGQLVRRLLDDASRLGCSPRTAAANYAMARLGRMRAALGNPTLRTRGLGVGIELLRAGLLPPKLIAPMARRYFESRFE